MQGMLVVKLAILLVFNPAGVQPLVFIRSVIAAFAFLANQINQFPWHLSTYSMIWVTTPEPMVRPPSRMAKRSPSFMAMGVISSADI